MTTTRTKNKVAMKRILAEFMELEDDDPVVLALAQNKTATILNLLALTQNQIDSLFYKDDAVNVRLADHERGIIEAFQAFVVYRSVTGNPIQQEDWDNLEPDEFDEFRVSPEFISRRSGNILAPLPIVTHADAVKDFKRGIKRDASQFPKLKDEKQWDSWNRATIAQARAQDVSNVLDMTYKPVNLADIALLDEQKKYMYAVFEQSLLTDKGKALVRQYALTFDAQSVYHDLCKYALTSTRAAMDSSKLLTHITSARLGDGSWKGSTQAFLLNWQDKVRVYQTLVPTTDHFSDGIKRTMLENTVVSLPELRQVKNTAAQHKVQTGKDLTYEQYADLLLSASQLYDEQFTPKNPRRPPRSVYNTEIFHDADDFFDIDSDPDPREAYSSQVEDRGPRLQFEQWKSLDPTMQAIWDTLTPDAKRTILQPRTSRTPRRKANMHDMSAFDYLQAHLHDLSVGSETDTIQILSDETTETQVQAPEDLQVNNSMVKFAKKGSTLPIGDLQRTMSSSLARDEKKTPADEIKIAGQTYVRKVNVCNIQYTMSAHRQVRRGGLVDRGANGGIAGDDTRIIAGTGRFVDIQGIDNHQMADIQVVSAGAVIPTHRGEVIVIMHQYASVGRGKTIHSCGQLEWHKSTVDDKSIKVGGTQTITTIDGYVIPLNIQAGLPYVKMRPYTDKEWDELPHVVLTSDNIWNPSVLDHSLDDDEQWYDSVQDPPSNQHDNLFDEYGDYRHRHVVSNTEVYAADGLCDDILTNENVMYDIYGETEYFYPEDNNTISINERRIDTRERDYSSLRPNFGWLPTETIKKTFEATTQNARMPHSTTLKKHYRSPYPALNVHRRSEPVATDTVYSDTPAVDCGHTQAQIFVGTKTMVTDVYGMKTDKQFVNTLEDNIRRRGAMDKLISDRAQVEISNRVLDILRSLYIGDWQSEPHQQHQNPSERRYQTVKRLSNTVMDRTGSPAYTWLLALMYICFLLNFMATPAHGWRTPMEKLTGSTPDISPFLRFHWYEAVYYKLDDSDFPSESPELRGRFVGISEHVGHAMTYKVLTDDTKKIIHRSNIRTAADPTAPNLRLDPIVGETTEFKTNEFITERTKNDEDDKTNQEKATELIGRTFLMDTREDGQRHRARIVEAIEEMQEGTERHPEHIKFKCSINEGEYEEIISYNQILERIEREQEDPTVWKFRRITAHEGPLSRNSPQWKGSSHNVMLEWENGEITAEPLGIVGKDDPVTCAIYARDNNLLDEPGWKRFKHIAKRQKKMFRMANQAKLRSFRTAPKYQYGFEIPRDYEHAKQLDSKNKNDKWQTATDLEMQQLDAYDTFIDVGKDGETPKGSKRIRVHLIYACKHDGRHKARLVADGHLTDVPVDSVYSGVVSLRGLRLIIFLAELNNLETWATDIGNAYLEAVTDEKVHIVAGPEFGEKSGSTLVIYKALYGLRSSGLRWHEKLADVLRDMGFSPCKAEPDIWMRENDGIYEYIGVYVDDLAIAMRDPQSLLDILTTRHNFKLKGSGPMSFHLGCDFFRDDDGVLCMAPKKHVEKMIQGYEMMFGETPKHNVRSPLEKGDHPELDTSELMDEVGIQRYQSIIGSLQWAVSLGRLDIATAVMSMSSFRAAPRIGHLDRAKRICGYLSKMRHAVIRFRVGEPDYSELSPNRHDWERSVYGDVEEAVPYDAPTPLGKPVTLTHYVDANLYHDMITGRSVTAILHMINQTPLDFFTKKQATVETATYGSEYVAARTCTEQLMDIRTTLRYLGVPIRGQSYMFGDNESVVNSSMNLDAKLHKRHTALSFHRVREAIASRAVGFYHLAGAHNPADILSKHWAYSAVWKLMRPLLFWEGDTIEIPTDEHGGPVDLSA